MSFTAGFFPRSKDRVTGIRGCFCTTVQIPPFYLSGPTPFQRVTWLLLWGLLDLLWWAFLWLFLLSTSLRMRGRFIWKFRNKIHDILPSFTIFACFYVFLWLDMLVVILELLPAKLTFLPAWSGDKDFFLTIDFVRCFVFCFFQFLLEFFKVIFWWLDIIS